MQKNKIEIWVLELKLYLLEDIDKSQSLNKISYFIDSILKKDEKFLKYHNERCPKGYVFNSFYPIEKSGIYPAGKIYTVQIRTVNKEVKDYFMEHLKNNYTKELKGLTITAKKLECKYIEKLVSVTPIIMKTENAYWRGNLTIEDFLNRIKLNLLKKYKLFFGEDIDDTEDIFEKIEFTNPIPIKCPYKNINLLGDKVILTVAKNPTAQKLAFLSLGAGISEMASRGYSYVNPRWI